MIRPNHNSSRFIEIEEINGRKYDFQEYFLHFTNVGKFSPLNSCDYFMIESVWPPYGSVVAGDLYYEFILQHFTADNNKDVTGKQTSITFLFF